MRSVARSRLVLAGIVVLAVGVAWLIRWGTDDAFISFVYARDLVRGDGLTWFGDRVEGYTNFGWVLWIAGGLAAGLDPLVFAWIGSLAALAVAIAATHQVVQLRTGSATAAACAAGLLATNFTFVAFATSGLETMPQTALLALAWWQVERIQRGAATPRRLALLSATCALALWMRLDSAVICAVLAVVVGRQLLRGGVRGGWAAALGPAAALVGGWLAWKLAYYGDVLPNTFHAKVDLSARSIAHGAWFVGAFLQAYLLWPILPVVVAIAITRRRPGVLPAAIAGAWLAYVVLVGGDFMEFRFFVPVMPALFALVAEAMISDRWPASAPRAPVRAAAVVALLAAASWRHAATFHGIAEDKSYDSVGAMATFYGMLPDQAWHLPGRVLREPLAGTGATLACNGAGAIPYFSDLPTVDQLGLNDAWVARHGVRPPEDYLRPGHQRFATYDYLVERKVTFVIGSPLVIPRGALSRARSHEAPGMWLGMFLGHAARRVPDLVAVAAPLDDDRALVMWYLTPSPEITARIQAAGWEVRRLVFSGAHLPTDPR